MRANLGQDPLLDVAPHELPIAPHVVFGIRRRGATKAARLHDGQQRAAALGRVLSALREDPAGIASDILKASEASENGEVNAAAVLINHVLERRIGSNILSQVVNEDSASSAAFSLVAWVKGLELSDDASGKALTWEQGGAEFLATYYEHVTLWILKVSQEMEDRFQAYVKDALGNSQPSSASSSAGEGEATA
jgi:hypothetical protein